MKSVLLLFSALSAALTACAEPFPLIPVRDDADLFTFRKYAERKSLSPIAPNSIRVFYMGQGAIMKIAEISFDTGMCKIWPGHFDQSEVKEFKILKTYSIKSTLEWPELSKIPTDVSVSYDGLCQLIEINYEGQYYWRMHRNSTSGYFRAIAALVDLASQPPKK